MTWNIYLQRAFLHQSYLWPPGTSLPSGTDPQSFHAFSTLPVTLGANMFRLHDWPSCFISYHIDRGHWFHSSLMQRYEHDRSRAVLFCCSTLIKDAGSPCASSSLTRPIVEGEGIRWWNGHQGSCSLSQQSRTEAMGGLALYAGTDI